jgi:hypothetical protein
LRVNGSFELSVGDEAVIRGQGQLTVELGQQALRSLRPLVPRQRGEASPAVGRWLEAARQFTETVRATRDILQTLSDPTTQASLRQVTQLLQMLDQLPGS